MANNMNDQRHALSWCSISIAFSYEVVWSASSWVRISNGRPLMKCLPRAARGASVPSRRLWPLPRRRRVALRGFCLRAFRSAAQICVQPISKTHCCAPPHNTLLTRRGGMRVMRRRASADRGRHRRTQTEVGSWARGAIYAASPAATRGRCLPPTDWNIDPSLRKICPLRLKRRATSPPLINSAARRWATATTRSWTLVEQPGRSAMLLFIHEYFASALIFLIR